MMQLHKNNQAGFSFVETLVAITILLVVITGPLAITTATSRSTDLSSEQIIATFLAQEGAELAQKARDDILLNEIDSDTTAPIFDGVAWSTFTTGATYSNCFVSVNTDGCSLEMNPTSGTLKAPTDCGSGAANCRLYYKAADHERNRYTYSSGGGTNVLTPFTRVIKMTLAGDQLEVKSTVTWRTGSLKATQKAEVTTYLYNVYDY